MTEPGRSDLTGAKRRFYPLPPWVSAATRLVHSGRFPDLNAGAIAPPIYQTSTFHFPEEYSESARAGEVYLYSRIRNPSVEGPEEIIRELEGGETARLFASGMGAITASLLSLLQSGDEVVALSGLYGGSTDLVNDLLPRYGIRVREVSDSEAQAPEEVVSPATRVILIESPTNPLLHVHDIARWARVADGVGAVLAVDNTFATPLNQTPLSLGAELALHSATKYLGGHSDLTAGAAVGPARILEKVDPKHFFGASLDPFAAFLLHRSLRTLGLRVARHNENGRRVVEALENHPALDRIFYPGRASAEEEGIASRQMRGRGGMVSLSLKGGAAAAERFLHHLKIVRVASSLGGVESLASVPGRTSHRYLTSDQLVARGIGPGLVRISLGIEAPEDLVRDLTEALDDSQ
jgi:methionine-gamma-lyase